MSAGTDGRSIVSNPNVFKSRLSTEDGARRNEMLNAFMNSMTAYDMPEMTVAATGWWIFDSQSAITSNLRDEDVYGLATKHVPYGTTVKLNNPEPYGTQ